MAVFLAGTSGTGKSTLASLLAARMGITTILSTDSIRHMLRGFTTPEADPLLWASTYQVDFITIFILVTIYSLAKPCQARFCMAMHSKNSSLCTSWQVGELVPDTPPPAQPSPSTSPANAGRLDSKQRTIQVQAPMILHFCSLQRCTCAGVYGCTEMMQPCKYPLPCVSQRFLFMHPQGYKAQAEAVCELVDKLVAGCEARGESLVVEGVHLSMNFVVKLMRRHPSIVPFLIHISNEQKHRERFAVRILLRPAAIMQTS